MKNSNKTAVVSDPRIGLSKKQDTLFAEFIKAMAAGEELPGRLLVLGSLTAHGLPEEADRFFGMLKPVQDAGVEIVTMPGGKDYISERYNEAFGKYMAKSIVPGKMVTKIDLGDIDLLCLDTPDGDSADPDAWGYFCGEQLELVQKFVKDHVDAKRPYIFAGYNKMIPSPAKVDLFTSATAWIISGADWDFFATGIRGWHNGLPYYSLVTAPSFCTTETWFEVVKDGRKFTFTPREVKGKFLPNIKHIVEY